MEKERRFPIWAKIVIPIVAIALVLGILFMFGIFTPKTEVPNITSMNFDKAVEMLSKEGIQIFIESTEIKDSVNENTILTQSPEPGTKVKGEVVIAVIVSEKSVQIEVPDVSDYTKSLAKEKLQSAGATVKVKEEYSDTVPSGSVISQSVIGSSSNAKKVTLVVSKGPKTNKKTVKKTDAEKQAVEELKLKGLKKEEAKKLVEAKGFSLVVSAETYSDTVPAGCVISKTVSGSNVKVTLSKGRKSDEKILVPKVEFLTENEAKTQLTQRGFTVTTVYATNKTVPKGAVISQSVKSGEKVSAGTKIILTVSSGMSAPTTATTATTTKPVTTAKPTTKPTTKPTPRPTTTKKPATTIDYASEQRYVADFRISTDKTSASAGDIITVNVALKTNYNIFTVMLPIIYDGNVFEVANTSSGNVSSFLTFKGRLNDGAYTTNGNWKPNSSIYSRNNNTEYWTREDVMDRWKIAYASWSVNSAEGLPPVRLSSEETIVSFQLKVKSDVSDTTGRIFISPDFRKTPNCVQGTLGVARCKDDKFSMNFVECGQTIRVDRADVKITIQ